LRTIKSIYLISSNQNLGLKIPNFGTLNETIDLIEEHAKQAKIV
jgi:hypothetical protein